MGRNSAGGFLKPGEQKEGMSFFEKGILTGITKNSGDFGLLKFHVNPIEC
jgi:hypothetical protein